MESKTKWAIYNNPLPLLNIKKESILKEIDNYLPYSVGLEIECMHGPNFVNTFKDIPDIMSVDNENKEYEQRYRIPNGLKGLVCLFRICEELRKQCVYHPRSGIHCHIDFTDIFVKGIYGYDTSPSRNILENNWEWISAELDTWEYKGDYNGRWVGSWIRWNCLGTLEFRIIEMTFDYNELVTKLIHACNISRKLKQQMILTPAEKKLLELNKELEEKNKLIPVNTNTDIPSANQLIKKRVIKL